MGVVSVSFKDTFLELNQVTKKTSSTRWGEEVERFVEGEPGLLELVVQRGSGLV